MLILRDCDLASKYFAEQPGFFVHPALWEHDEGVGMSTVGTRHGSKLHLGRGRFRFIAPDYTDTIMIWKDRFSICIETDENITWLRFHCCLVQSTRFPRALLILQPVIPFSSSVANGWSQKLRSRISPENERMGSRNVPWRWPTIKLLRNSENDIHSSSSCFVYTKRKYGKLLRQLTKPCINWALSRNLSYPIWSSLLPWTSSWWHWKPLGHFAPLWWFPPRDWSKSDAIPAVRPLFQREMRGFSPRPKVPRGWWKTGDHSSRLLHCEVYLKSEDTLEYCAPLGSTRNAEKVPSGKFGIYSFHFLVFPSSRVLTPILILPAQF